MRQVATIPDEANARKLADYLLTLGVTTRVDRGKDGFLVWVHREDRMDLARGEVAAFLANPDDSRYDGASKAAQEARREEARRQRQHARNTVNLSGRLNVPSFLRCPVTYTLIALCVATGALTDLANKERASELFMLSPRVAVLDASHTTLRWESSGLSGVSRGEVWRLVAPIFLHIGIVHLVFNMTMFYRLGCLIEMRKGRALLLLLVLVTAVISNLAQYWWMVQTEGPTKPHLFGGMSGVICALFGYCWMVGEYDPEADMRMPTDMIVWTIGWILLCSTGTIGPIANAAHVAGLFAGLLIGVAPHLFRGRW